MTLFRFAAPNTNNEHSSKPLILLSFMIYGTHWNEISNLLNRTADLLVWLLKLLNTNIFSYYSD